MNWTGGALGRSRNANTSLTVIQKAHFAKARGRLEASHASPPSFENLEIFSIRPRAKKGEYRDRTTGHTQHNKVNSDLMTKTLQATPRHHASEKTMVSRIRSSKSPPTERLPRYPQAATRSSPVFSSSQGSSSISVLQVEDSCDLASSAVEAQRARLLNMHDWVGICHTKPARIHFTDSNDRDQIGKRRRLSEMKYPSSHSRRRLGSRHRTSRQSPSANEQLSLAEISVRIGSAVDRKSVRDEAATTSLSKQNHTSRVSDEMLLDERFSDQATSSHNTWRERRHAHDSKWLQPPKPRNCRFTPSAFIEEIQYPKTRDNFAEEINSIQGTLQIQRGLALLNQSLPPSGTLEELEPSSSRSDDEFASLRYTFEETPTLRESSTDPRMENSQERNLDVELCDSSSEEETFLKPPQETSTILNLRVKDPVTPRRSFDTSPLRQEIRECHRKLHSPPASYEQHADQLRDEASTTSRPEDYTGLRTNMIDENFPTHSILPPVILVDPTPRYVRGDEKPGEEKWKRVAADGPQEPLEACPNSWLSNYLNRSDRLIPHFHTAEGQRPKDYAGDHKKIVDEDEALWRSFVFGGEDPTSAWIMDPEEGSGATAATQTSALNNPPLQTQPSMEAEIATSPIKQNLHLLEDGLTSSPTAKTNGASHIADASSLSQSNSDEMLDEMLDGVGSSCLHVLPQMPETLTRKMTFTQPTLPSSNAAQASNSTSPVRILDPLTADTTAGIRSPILVLASSQHIPSQVLSSDELAWSSSRICQSSIEAAVVFKKPQRYPH